MLVGALSFVLIGCCLSQSTNGPAEATTFPAGDIRNCQTTSNNGDHQRRVQRFEVIPGSGWDNLRNVETGMVLSINYTLCRTTDDQRFLIPDYMNIYPIKTSRVDSFAEIVSSYQDYESVTSRSVNVDAGFKGLFSISGTFSDDYKYTKKKQLEDDTMTTRVQERYVRYRAVLQPDMELNPAFKYRLLTIAASLELYNAKQARFDAQQLVREFGTHVTTSVDAGAVLVMEEQVSVDIRKVATYTDAALKAGAKFSFASQVGLFWAGASYDSETQKTFNAIYMANRTDSLIRAIGGNIANRTNFTREQWTDMIDHDLVAIDRSGEPIFNFITAQTLPEIPASLMIQLSNLVREAVTTYYNMNSHPGCTDRTSQNFSPRSNVDDGSCRPPDVANLTFGGVYQSCTNQATEAGDLCASLTRTNPLTGDFTCPKGYEPVSLHSGSKSNVEVDHVCGHCWLIFGHCCHDETKNSNAQYETFWCVSQNSGETHDTGYMFGGVYTSHVTNPATSSFNCPHAYVALKVSDDLNVCVSDEFSIAVEHEIPFAGFFSCQSGNPLALGHGNTTLSAHMYTSGPSVWPKRCPVGYSQYMAEMTPGDGCEINYCILASALKKVKLPSIRRPPYIHAPFNEPNPQNAFVFDVAQNLWEVNAQVNNQSGKRTKVLEWWRPKAADRNGYRHQGNGYTNGRSAFISDADSFVAGIIVLLLIEVSVIVIGASFVVCLKAKKGSRNGGRWEDDGEKKKFRPV